MKESTPTLLRAIGLIILLAVTTCAHFVAREQAKIGRKIVTGIMKFNLTRPFEGLSDQEKKRKRLPNYY